MNLRPETVSHCAQKKKKKKKKISKKKTEIFFFFFFFFFFSNDGEAETTALLRGEVRFCAIGVALIFFDGTGEFVEFALTPPNGERCAVPQSLYFKRKLILALKKKLFFNKEIKTNNKNKQ
jgi:hypothetical protein